MLNTILSIVAPVRSSSLQTVYLNQLTRIVFSYLSKLSFRGKQTKSLAHNSCFYSHHPSSPHILISPQLALHSIFCSRVIFIILSQQRSQDDANSDTLLHSTHGVIVSSILNTYATRDDLLWPHPRGESQYSRNPP